jgi:hypothetical protein
VTLPFPRIDTSHSTKCKLVRRLGQLGRYASKRVKTQKTIRNCIVTGFDFVCPREWHELLTTDRETERRCNECNEIVYLCVSDDETTSHARSGHCIAREVPDESELPTMYLGRPKKLPPITKSQKQALAWTSRERGIDDSLKNMDAQRQCPECNYPAPDWRKTCRVCGFEMGRVFRDNDA